MPELSPFLLEDDQGGERSFPGRTPALICFVKEDCPTCDQLKPLLEALHLALGDAVDFFVVGQTLAGNRTLKSRHGLSVPLLDDSALKVSYAYDVEIVPTLLIADAAGEGGVRLQGFVRQEWREALGALAAQLGKAPLDIPWAEYPEWWAAARCPRIR